MRNLLSSTIVALVFSAAVTLTGCGHQDDAPPPLPTVGITDTATVTGSVPPLVGAVTITVAGQPATVTNQTWSAPVTLTDHETSVDVVLALEGQTVARRIVTVTR